MASTNIFFEFGLIFVFSVDEREVFVIFLYRRKWFLPLGRNGISDDYPAAHNRIGRTEEHMNDEEVCGLVETD